MVAVCDSMSYAHAVLHSHPPQSLEVVWPQPPAPCPSRNRTLILFNDYEPSINSARTGSSGSGSNAQTTAGGRNTTIWSPAESYIGAVWLGDASDTCGLDVYGNGSLAFGRQGGGSLELQNVTVPADATWSVHVGWTCTTWYSSRTELALEYYDAGEVGSCGQRHRQGQKG